MWSAVAFADDFVPPNGCEGRLTVQFKGCLMLNIWTCDADKGGDQWLALFTEGGMNRLRKIDSEFQWLETYSLGTGLVEKIITPEPDPENLTELFRDQTDTYDFTITQSGPTAGPDERILGYDKLTGKTTIIDGESLLNTEYAYDVLDTSGNVVSQHKGRQFVHPDYRIFLFGQSIGPDGGVVRDNRPMSFAKPGDNDFFPDQPRFGCGAVLS
jgi:hypothetical protein